MVFLIDSAGGKYYDTKRSYLGGSWNMAPTYQDLGSSSSGITGVMYPGFGFSTGGTCRPLYGIRGYLWTSKAFNKYGDKECEHVALSGYLFARIKASSYISDFEAFLQQLPDMAYHDGEQSRSGSFPFTYPDSWNKTHVQYYKGNNKRLPTYFSGFLPIDALSRCNGSGIIACALNDPLCGYDSSQALDRTTGLWTWSCDGFVAKPQPGYLKFKSKGDGTIWFSRSRLHIGKIGSSRAQAVTTSQTVDEEWKVVYDANTERIDVSYYRDGELQRSGWGTPYSNQQMLATYEVPESALSSYLNSLVDEIRDFDYSFILNEYKGFLIKEAIDNCRALDINTTAYLRDVARIWHAIKPVFDVFKQPLSAKAWANLWLTYRYGIRLFIMDSMKIMKAYDSGRLTQKPNFFKGRSRRVVPATVLGKNASIELHLEIKGSDQGVILDDFFRILRNLDLLVGLENAWDMIPYSFVVDWFIPISKVLEDIDKHLDLVLYDIQDFIYSIKVKLPVDLPSPMNVTGNVELKHYKRWREDPEYSLSVHPYALGEGINMTHAADGMALMIQRSRKL